jgi:precorrin-6Y C5,15-methyltransferase (decarboxylating)
VHPAPSAAALAFARAGLAWDDAVVVSAHGRPVEPALDAVVHHSKVAVLTSPEHPPESLGRGLVAAGCGRRVVVVAARLGEPDEEVWTGDLAGLAGGRFDARSVVLCLAPEPRGDAGPGWAWGLPDHTYQHRDGLITKAEVRAVALGKLRLPAAGVLWDVGAGSGSVAAECARLSPGLRVFAIERRPDDAHRLLANLAGTGAAVVEGNAPDVLAGLPDPDRVFVGGGGLAVLDAVMSRVRPGGTVVATYAALDRAAAAATRLGHLVQVAVSRGVAIGADRAVRLAADNPVFVCWGPEE